MNYKIIPSLVFLKQTKKLNNICLEQIENKFKLVKINPYRNKRIKFANLMLFRIRIKNQNKEKRIIYWVKENNVVDILFILNRDKNYKDLKKYLKRLGLP